MNGHYVQYELPEGVEVLDVKYRETGYDTSFAGSFSCDDPMLTRLWTSRSVRSTSPCATLIWTVPTVSVPSGGATW